MVNYLLGDDFISDITMVNLSTHSLIILQPNNSLEPVIQIVNFNINNRQFSNKMIIQ